MENLPSPAVLEEYAKTWGTWQLGELRPRWIEWLEGLRVVARTVFGG